MEEHHPTHKGGQLDWVRWLLWVFWGQWRAQDACRS